MKSVLMMVLLQNPKLFTLGLPECCTIGGPSLIHYGTLSLWLEWKMESRFLAVLIRLALHSVTTKLLPATVPILHFHWWEKLLKRNRKCRKRKFAPCWSTAYEFFSTVTAELSTRYVFHLFFLLKYILLGTKIFMFPIVAPNRHGYRWRCYDWEQHWIGYQLEYGSYGSRLWLMR